MATALDIIKRSLRLINAKAAGEQVEGEEANDAFNVLNDILEDWSNEKLMVYYMLNEVFQLTANDGEYTIGQSTSDFNTTLPNRIESAFIRDDTSTTYNQDYKLDIIPNDRYQDIYQKSTTSTYPKYLNFVRAFPEGTIKLWPVPSQTYKLGLSQWKQITAFSGLTTTVSLPPTYKSALQYALAVEMAPEYGIEPPATVILLADEKKNILRRVNTEEILMTTDQALLPNRLYNIYGDRY